MNADTTGTRGEQRVALVVSSGAGHANGGESPEALLEAAGLRVVERIEITELDARLPMGKRWRGAGLHAVVAAGGDGTVGGVASHLVGDELPLGILPMGTSNDVARSLGVPLDLAEAARAIASGVVARVDVGQAAPAVTEPGALASGRFSRLARSLFRGRAATEREALQRAGAAFLHAATLGMNVEFARLATDVARRERWGPLNYPTAMIESLAHMEPIPVTIDLREVSAYAPFDGAPTRPEPFLTIDCRVAQIAVVNTRVFGGGFNLEMPGVQANDHLLDILIIEALEPRHLRETIDELLTALGRLKDRLGSDGSEAGGAIPTDASAGLLLPGVRRYQARSVRIVTATPFDVTLDGEIRGRTPMDIRVAPEPLRVLLPVAAREALDAGA